MVSTPIWNCPVLWKKLPLPILDRVAIKKSHRKDKPHGVWRMHLQKYPLLKRKSHTPRSMRSATTTMMVLMMTITTNRIAIVPMMNRSDALLFLPFLWQRTKSRTTTTTKTITPNIFVVIQSLAWHTNTSNLTTIPRLHAPVVRSRESFPIFLDKHQQIPAEATSENGTTRHRPSVFLYLVINSLLVVKTMQHIDVSHCLVITTLTINLVLDDFLCLVVKPQTNRNQVMNFLCPVAGQMNRTHLAVIPCLLTSNNNNPKADTFAFSILGLPQNTIRTNPVAIPCLAAWERQQQPVPNSQQIDPFSLTMNS
mmetsp:Transcript_7081/g.10814  ORF Transcript_7081/g.10814 Transcript_7081/m.10814 type:complete len:310 (+) Transcript_7081:100-1029(+)